MMKKVDISSYLEQAHEDDGGAQPSENGAIARPKHDPMYSAVFGWGFSGMPKLLPPEAHPNGEVR
jgi:hypothetical protein